MIMVHLISLDLKITNKHTNKFTFTNDTYSAATEILRND